MSSPPTETIQAATAGDPTFLQPGATEFGITSPQGIFSLHWNRDTRFFLVRNGEEVSQVEVDGLASAEGEGASILATAVTDNGHFCISVSHGAGAALFVAGPDGIPLLRLCWDVPVHSLGLAASGSWLAVQAGEGLDKSCAQSGLLHAYNVAKGELLWASRPWTGPARQGYEFDEVSGTLRLNYGEDRSYSYRLLDGNCLDRARYRMDLLVSGTAPQLVRLAHQEFSLAADELQDDAAARRALGKRVFPILTVAAQRAPDWAPAFTALGEFFEWLPDINKARRCHARAVELDPSPANLSNLARLEGQESA